MGRFEAFTFSHLRYASSVGSLAALALQLGARNLELMIFDTSADFLHLSIALDASCGVRPQIGLAETVPLSSLVRYAPLDT